MVENGDGAGLSETPAKRARPRPVSEQMLGRPRPQAICDNSEGDGECNGVFSSFSFFPLAEMVFRSDAFATGCSYERFGFAH